MSSTRSEEEGQDDDELTRNSCPVEASNGRSLMVFITLNACPQICSRNSSSRLFVRYAFEETGYGYSTFGIFGISP
jgi:hypothetical protein